MASSRRRCTSAAELIELRIREFAIVDELTLRLEPGLNVLTGETGAGKSILIDALGAVLGDRASPTMVRAGTDRALIEATFSRPERLPEDIEISPEDDVLILSREIGASGRGAARINGRTVPVSMLQAAGRALVDVHGQSDHQSLLRPASHLYFLDRFGGLDEARESVAALVRELRQVRQELARLQGDAREMVRRQDLLRFQVEEIDGAALAPGEDEELAARRAVLANAERLREFVASAVAALGEESGAIDAALAAAKSVSEAARLDPALAEHADQLDAAAGQLQDVSRALSRYADAVEADPDELQRVDDRLDLLRSLKRKYGETLDEVLAYAESARGELAQLLGADARIEELQAREQELLAQVRAAAVALSQSRQEAATRLNGEVEAQLADLNMAGARFYAEVNARPGEEDPQPTGIDDVQFLLSANRGEPLRPLAQVASGGEASRLMLALKSVFSAVDETPVLVFDEIEVGVGARSGHVIGQKLRALAEHHQVLCITHLAPVAALAEAHFRVRKLEAGGRTGTAVDRLDQSERVDELAEMLAGKPIGEAARASARELLGAASATA
ncbi:MAG TPA: DNA repair protein RecN [Chloroflexota bacterium]|nr:DNA repair protein RecN [Chloroflexota bacterium]